MNQILKRLAAWLRLSRPAPPPILPVPFGGYIRVGRTLPSYLEASDYLETLQNAGCIYSPEPDQCRRCSYRNPDFASRLYLRCALYPLGPDHPLCPDYEEADNHD